LTGGSAEGFSHGGCFASGQTAEERIVIRFFTSLAFALDTF